MNEETIPGGETIAHFFRSILQGLVQNEVDTAELDVKNVEIGGKKFTIKFDIQITNIQEQE